MDRTASAAHAGHDELLIARLFGDDVDETERAQALDLIAECTECASLFADLGAVADASAAMPVPVRPRDFTLTEADAARLRRKRSLWSPILGSGLRRSLGSSLAAIGLAGAILTGVASFLGGTASSAPMQVDQRANVPIAAAAVPASGATAAGIGFGSSGVTAGPAGTIAAPILAPAAGSTPVASQASPVRAPAAATPANGSNPVVPPPAESSDNSAHQTSRASSEIALAGGNTEPSGGKSTNSQLATESGSTESGSTESGMDSRLLWLGGFGLLFAIGLAITLLPRLPRPRLPRGPGRGARA
jgi:anti-sigma factor RsiW